MRNGERHEGVRFYLVETSGRRHIFRCKDGDENKAFVRTVGVDPSRMTIREIDVLIASALKQSGAADEWCVTAIW